MPDEKDRPTDGEIPFADAETCQPGKGRRLIKSDTIFCGETSAFIAHGEEVYTLRVTKQGKLVLNK